MNGGVGLEEMDVMRGLGLWLIAAALLLFPGRAQGGEREVYLIDSFEALVRLCETVYSGEGAFTGEVRLTEDIEAEGEFLPIGDEEHMFSGLFDGQGHVISGLRVKASGDFSGLFGCIGREGVVRGLTLENVLISGGRFTGAVAGYSSGLIENCTVGGGRVIGNSANEFGTAAGGIVGLTDGYVEGCVNLDAAVYGLRYTGGIAGSLCAGRIERCLSSGNVFSPYAGEALCGGVAGSVQGGGKAEMCIGLGTVYAQHATDTGGVAGGILSGSVSKCIFLGEVYAEEPGAIAGYAARRAQIMACMHDAGCPVGVGEGKESGVMLTARYRPVEILPERLLPFVGG